MGKTVELHFATKDKYVHHVFTHRLIKKSLKNSTAAKSYDKNKKLQKQPKLSRSFVVLGFTGPGVGSIPGGGGIMSISRSNSILV